jgi:hypothetical protein
MKRLLLPLFCCLLFTSSCSDKDEEPAKDTYEYFSSHITSTMTYDTIVKLFGSPDGDIGSGIHIYVYLLADGTKIWIGYTDKIHYVKHVDANGVVLHTII